MSFQVISQIPSSLGLMAAYLGNSVDLGLGYSGSWLLFWPLITF